MAEVLQNFDQAFAITPSDTVNFVSPIDAVYVGGAGNISFVFSDGTSVVFTAPPVGSILPIRCMRINATLTTATLLVGLRQI